MSKKKPAKKPIELDKEIGNQLVLKFDDYHLTLESIIKLPKGKTAFLLKSIKPIPNPSRFPDIGNPAAGTIKFFVMCSKLTAYTSIGADNRHHAANKATKLFGPHWTSLTEEPLSH